MAQVYGYVNIGGAEYGVEQAIDERDGSLYGYLLLSPVREGEVYEVTPQPGGRCTCPHYTIRLRGTGRTCKHIDAIRRCIAEGELAPVTGGVPQFEEMS